MIGPRHRTLHFALGTRMAKATSMLAVLGVLASFSGAQWTVAWSSEWRCSVSRAPVCNESMRTSSVVCAATCLQHTA